MRAIETEKRSILVPSLLSASDAPQIQAFEDMVDLRTDRPLQFVDVTELLAERVRRSGIECGLACIQCLHTTAGIVVNENEPLLMEDLERTLEHLAPRGAAYAHDDLERRRGAPEGVERKNGHSHCKTLMLSPSAVLSVVQGRLRLGRWQRVLLAEMDGGQQRSLSILVFGIAGDERI